MSIKMWPTECKVELFERKASFNNFLKFTSNFEHGLQHLMMIMNCRGQNVIFIRLHTSYIYNNYFIADIVLIAANIVSLLIDHGASVEARNRRQETALMCSHNINISRTILFSTQDENDQGSMSSYVSSVKRWP